MNAQTKPLFEFFFTRISWMFRKLKLMSISLKSCDLRDSFTWYLSFATYSFKLYLINFLFSLKFEDNMSLLYIYLPFLSIFISIYLLPTGPQAEEGPIESLINPMCMFLKCRLLSYSILRYLIMPSKLKKINVFETTNNNINENPVRA